MPRNIEAERKRIDKIWSGSNPGCVDLTRDALKNVAIAYLRDIEQLQKTLTAYKIATGVSKA